MNAAEAFLRLHAACKRLGLYERGLLLEEEKYDQVARDLQEERKDG